MKKSQESVKLQLTDEAVIEQVLCKSCSLKFNTYLGCWIVYLTF